MHTSNPKTSSYSGELCLLSLKKLPPVASSSSPPVGDYIGIESCLDMKRNDDVSEESDGSRSLSRDRRRIERDQKWGKSATTKQFPPPIPLLARTENLSSHMPWVLKRYYTDDGRLILKEERVKHHEYFLAHRCNGRLTLQLIPLDDEVNNNYPPLEEDEEEEVSNDNGELEVKEESEITDNCCVNYEDYQKRNGDNNGGLGGSLTRPFKCLNYNTIIQTCIFQIPVPALRPVHT